MTTEYRDSMEDDSSSFWNKEPAPMTFSRTSRIRRWLAPALTAAVLLILVIAVGATNTKMLNQICSSNHLCRTVTELKCSFERFVNNGSVSGACCPLGWETSGSTCYFFSKVPLSWNDARDWCNAHESHLVILMTDSDWDFVTAQSTGTFYWVGLTDERTGKWEWVNQTPYVMNRRRWKPGQPDSWTGHGLGSGDEDCAHLHHDGRLNDLHCSTRLRFICQKRSQSS
ncbi:hypothetical protein OJAV_G00185960 [Oryzias javanicus]|uniref:C-type lectin domain-containing protein n=1 Tax=Oryzias javanicus TaxID=123683 RepID=A0A437CDK9_ORYJA|nr:hypothetical protein OJAV_G00185960 [Oryzias javanicus]